MIKLITALIIVLNLSFAATNGIDKKISNNKRTQTSNEYKKRETTLKIKLLANRIKKQNKDLITLERNIKKINSDISTHEELLVKSKDKLDDLRNRSTDLMKEKKGNESQIVDTIIEDFSTSIALKLASKNNLKELIDTEIYTLLSQHTKDKILKLNNNYNLVSNDTKKNKKDIKDISLYIEKRRIKKKDLNTLKSKRSNSLVDLESQHKSYQRELNKAISKQVSLKNLLSKLNILKKEKLRKAEIKRRKAELKRKRLRELLAKKKRAKSNKKEKPNEIQTAEVRNQKYAKNLNLDVRKIGSSTSGVKIVRYRGAKTIAPLKSFKVIKKFGTYYDPIYKIKLFNESIVLKTNRPRAKVVSVLNGKVVYAKKNAGMLENVVIVQHQNGLHTIYSHLDEIAPTLEVGKWIKKGYVVGRVNSELTFQATKNSSHINPKDLFRT